MAKVDKTELAEALLELYSSTYEFNRIAGKNLSQDYADSQDKFIVEEAKEGILAVIEKDRKEVLDAIGDILVTASFRVMIQDGNTDLLKDHSEVFDSTTCVEDLWGQLLTYLLKEDWINVLGTAEDLLYRTDPNAKENILNIGSSNLSKFVPVGSLENPEEMCELIEAENRYTGVEYSVNKNSFGEEYYVFTATYDTKEKKAFSKPKVVKPKGFFVEPDLKV